MRFGLSFLPDASKAMKSAYDYFQEAILLSKIADEKGLHVVKMTEHYLHPYGGYCPSPLIFLTAVAKQTQNIRLMTGCILPSFHHPIQIAAHTALVDVLSSGRLDVGFGRAYLPYEFEAFGVDLDGSRNRYVETITAVIDLWTKPSSSQNNSFFSYQNASSLPDCMQKPHPPVWGAAVNSRQSFSWLGEKGFSLLITPPFGEEKTLLSHLEIYRSSFQEHHPEKKPQIGFSIPLLIHEDPSVAEDLSDQYLRHYLDVWADATKQWGKLSSSDYPKYQGLSQLIKTTTPKKMRENGQALVGTPQKVKERILELRNRLGIDLMMWQIDFGCQPYEVSKNSLELFTDQVLPGLFCE